MERLNLKKMGENIKRLREEKGLSQDELCDELEKYDAHISSRTLYKYENGDVTMKIEVLYALSKIFNRKVDYLFPTEENFINDGMYPLNDKAIDKINKLANQRREKEKIEKNRDLLKIKDKEVKPISEIEILNEIIVNTNLLETIVEQEKKGIQILREYLSNNKKVDIANDCYKKSLEIPKEKFCSQTEEQKETFKKQKENIANHEKKSRKELEKEKDLQLEIKKKNIEFIIGRLYSEHMEIYMKKLKKELKK